MSADTSNIAAAKSTTDEIATSPFLRLPFEIRLMIYEYLLFPSTQPSTSNSTSIANLLPDFHTYYSEDTNSTPFTLSVRTIDPWIGSQSSRTWRRRSTYHVRTGKPAHPLRIHCNQKWMYVKSRNLRRKPDKEEWKLKRRMFGTLLTCTEGPFLTTTTPTTYRVLLSPYTAHLRQNVPALLSLNHQTHAEASKVLYSTYTFSFHTSIEAVVPFLSDLTPLARSHIRHLSLTKKALPYTKEFDRAEWSSLCEYLTLHQQQPGFNHHRPQPQSSPTLHPIPLQPFQLRTLHLNVVAGKPDLGWDAISPITPTDFSTMMRMRSEWGGGDDGSLGGVDLEWAEQLMGIKGLKEMRVRALVEHCARPVSEKQAFWVAFSKSVFEGHLGSGFEGLWLGKLWRGGWWCVVQMFDLTSDTRGKRCREGIIFSL
ncbi:hypothetical protein N0V83_000700 [Neocucurbitaria cava]|uniref:Uncharacterized protein n=1 Tax=Neocucurbitaria cava TaxID=798079 RepID=A0A9W9CRD0_9PLEO|nr:hypothetical protein N0V83_000700 [Neocucurbitaria cava]